MLIDRIAADDVIDAAFAWLCEKRSHYHFNGDVWQVRRWWQEKKPMLQQQLRDGSFQFRELRLIRGDERHIEWWSSLDALVLKAMSLVLTEHLKPYLSARCFHLAGTGGMKAAVREVAANLEKNEFVFRTDVKGYYASINHHIFMEIVGHLQFKIKNSKFKMNEIIPIMERTFNFAVRIVNLCKVLDEKPGVGRTLAKQLISSGTSIGANVEESQAAQSTADFIHKLEISLRQLIFS